MTFLSFFGFWSSRCASWGLGFDIQTLCFLVVNGLIKGEIEKPSVQYLGLICNESLTYRCLNSNLRHFGSFTFILVSCGESRLLISWCAGSRCDMAGGEEDHGRSRRLSVEDRGWSSTGRVLGGRMIGRLGDTVCGLYRA
jgi:hypothetical protein